ncbi:hypothetical protein D9M71_626310 [compost metagenome]
MIRPAKPWRGVSSCRSGTPERTPDALSLPAVALWRWPPFGTAASRPRRSFGAQRSNQAMSRICSCSSVGIMRIRSRGSHGTHKACRHSFVRSLLLRSSCIGRRISVSCRKTIELSICAETCSTTLRCGRWNCFFFSSHSSRSLASRRSADLNTCYLSCAHLYGR